jgi:hypothetical protein
MPVLMVVPPSDTPSTDQGEYGFWLEVKDANARTLFRRVLHNPMPSDQEVFSLDPKRSVARVPGARQDQVFIVVVPRLSAAECVSLLSSYHIPESPLQPLTLGAEAKIAFRPPTQSTAAPAQEIARFALQKD